MANKKVSRRALFTSVISLILCCAMLMGTTFAWFTDSVTSGLNTINSGNLDVELMADGEKVDANTKLFDDVKLWEPGVVVYENLQVVNAGTLALKYQLSLNFGNENDLRGHKLSEVLKVAILDEKIDENTSRIDVLAAARAAVNADQGLGTLTNFVETGNLEAGQSSEERAVVIFWDANSAEVDNLYNANNGLTTSDGQPLHIDFGVQLDATQMMNESDSFGPDYDEMSSILPKATVNNVTADNSTISATMGIGGAVDESMPLDLALQFLPNEDLFDPDGTADNGDEYLDSEYRYWHADYVVSANKDVPANSMALAGYYSAFCDDFNGGNWVALTNDGLQITAGEEIRLLGAMGDVYVNYEEICRYGNDDIGFLCGAADLTGENAGTTLTVELRLYETTADPSVDSGNKNIETGNYKVVGRYTHTFALNTVAGLQAGLAAGGEVVLGADLDLGATQLTVPAGVKAVLNLNGYDLTGSYNGENQYAMFEIANGAELTVKGTGVVSANTNATVGNRSLAIFLNAGKLTLEGGTYNLHDTTEGQKWIIATIVDNRTNSADCATELIINGGDYSVSGMAKNLFRNYPQQGGSATLTINGGTFRDNGATTYIWNQESGSYPGNLNFNGGTYGDLVVYEDYNGQSDVYIAPGVSINACEDNT